MNLNSEQTVEQIVKETLEALEAKKIEIDQYQILGATIKGEASKEFNVKEVSVVRPAENKIRVVVMWRTKKNKPANLSVSLNYREGDKLGSSCNCSPSTKEGYEAASYILDATMKHLNILKDENLMYVCGLMFGVEHFRGYKLPEIRGVRRKSSRSLEFSPKISDIRLRVSEIEAKHKELLSKNWEDTFNVYKLDYDEGCMFKVYGRCKPFLDMLKEMNIVSDYSNYGGEYIVYFTREYDAPGYYIYNQWEPVFKDLGFRASVYTYYRD